MCKGKTFKSMLPLQNRATPPLNTLSVRKCSGCEWERLGIVGLEMELKMMYDYIRKIRLERKDIKIAIHELNASKHPDSSEVRMLDTLLVMMESKLIGVEFDMQTYDTIEHSPPWFSHTERRL